MAAGLLSHWNEAAVGVLAASPQTTQLARRGDPVPSRGHAALHGQSLPLTILSELHCGDPLPTLSAYKPQRCLFCRSMLFIFRYCYVRVCFQVKSGSGPGSGEGLVPRALAQAVSEPMPTAASPESPALAQGALPVASHLCCVLPMSPTKPWGCCFSLPVEGTRLRAAAANFTGLTLPFSCG